ncbi:hypothetical protein V494_05843 [Pseudogymnoascus sp. VKM F-4513 (FW-928)]|nr:hypothetical protein V494_05843 [Pseudogymnoascus sp. VKM F-4513 (FW-928)]
MILTCLEHHDRVIVPLLLQVRVATARLADASDASLIITPTVAADSAAVGVQVFTRQPDDAASFQIGDFESRTGPDG